MLVWIVSPTLILVPVYSTKTKWKQTRALPAKTLLSLKLIIIIIKLLLSINLLCLFLFVHQCFYTQARLR